MVILLNARNIRVYWIANTTGYSTDTVSVFLEKDIYNEIKECEYSKTLEEILDSKYYDDIYNKEYVKINYILHQVNVIKI